MQKPYQPSDQVEVAIPDPGSELAIILRQLSMIEIRYVVARMELPTADEAAKRIGIRPATYYNWEKDRKELIERALALVAQDGVMTALELRRRALAKAMAVKVMGLDDEDPKLRQSVATEIIEWELGKAKQIQELTGALSTETVIIHLPDNGREDANV